jgi:hypothetical protein
MNFVFESLEELFEDRTLLRTLTLKSRLDFGKFGKIPIESLAKSMPSYLRWVYYTYEAITFTEDVLDLIKIPIDKRIGKPGKDNYLWKELQTPGEKISQKAYLGLNHYPEEEKKMNQYNYKRGIRKDKDFLQKNVLKSKNRGIAT